MLPGGPKLLPATLARRQAQRAFSLCTENKQVKPLGDVTCAGLNTGPCQLWWDPALRSRCSRTEDPVTCCRKTRQFDHSDELKVSCEWESAQLRPFISVFYHLHGNKWGGAEKRLRSSGCLKGRPDNTALWLLSFHKNALICGIMSPCVDRKKKGRKERW